MKKFLIKSLSGAIGTLIRPSIETVEDETGFYLKLKLYLMEKKIFSARLYLKRNESGNVEPNQKIEL